jgi:hypothetical protein
MDNQEDKLLLPSFPKEAHIGNIWSASDTRGECHQDQTQFSTYHATREQQIVEIIADLPLLHADLFVDPCDKEELCDHTVYCRYFTGWPPKGIPKVVSLGVETPRSGTRRYKEHKI